MQQYSQGAQHDAASSRTVTTGFGEDPSLRLGPRFVPDQKQHDGSTLSLLDQLLQAASYSPAVTDLLLEQQLQHHQHAAHATAGLPHAAATAAEASMGLPCYVPASYLASWQQQQPQQQQQQQAQAATPLEQHCLQPAATEVQCTSEQLEDVLMSSSLSHGTASASAGSQPLPLTSQASLQQARSSQLLTQSLLRSSSSGPGSKSDTGRRTGAGSKPGGKALQAQAKLQLLYNAKLAEYDQLKAEQASLLMDQGLVLGMIRVMEQVLRCALTQAFERGTTAAASCSSAAGPAPPSLRAAAAAASDMLRKALAMEQQVEQLMAEQQRLLQCVPAAAVAAAVVPCGGDLVGSLLSQDVTADEVQVSASEWPQLCKGFGSSVSLLLHMLPSPTAGARAAAQLRQQLTQHLRRQLALMLQEPWGWLRVVAEAVQDLDARYASGPYHLLHKVAPTQQQAAQLRRLAALHGQLQEELRRRAALLQRPLAAAASKDTAAAEAAAAAGCARTLGGSGAATAAVLGLSLAGPPLAEHLVHAQQRESDAAALGRALQMQATLWGAAAHQCLALLSDKQAAMAYVACHPHALDPLLLAGLAADAAFLGTAAAEPPAAEAPRQV